MFDCLLVPLPIHYIFVGYDMAFATNYMGHFLLSRGLTDIIHKSSVEFGQRGKYINHKFYGRIINVASAFHYQPDGHMLRPIDGQPEAARSDVNTMIHRFIHIDVMPSYFN